MNRVFCKLFGCSSVFKRFYWANWLCATSFERALESQRLRAKNLKRIQDAIRVENMDITS